MDLEIKDPPRTFRVGAGEAIMLRDCGSVRLTPDEQLTFRGADGAETAFDVTRKDFGYYAANSLNATLPRQGLRPALCRNDAHALLYMLFVEQGKEDAYRAYLAAHGMTHLIWLDRMDPGSLPASKIG